MLKTQSEHSRGEGFPRSLIEFQQRFGDEAACAQTLRFKKVR
jgi:hypothetical protein